MIKETRVEFIPLEIEGSFAIITKPVSDERGDLIRIWENNSLFDRFDLSQASFVINPIVGTLRGVHYQKEPFSENKIVECVFGKVFDVIVDLRKDSTTFSRHLAIEIGPKCTYQGLFVPKGCAHGYLTIEPHSSLIYFMDKVYSPEKSSGILWNDKQLRIDWPSNPVLISDQDLQWPGLIV